MDKEIIIDGVNVAGCVQLVEEPFYPCGLGGECKGWENCYYKQLKRLQQDYVNLSKSFEHLQSSYQDNQEYCLQLKAENAKLKEEIRTEKIYSSQIEELEESLNHLKQENEKIIVGYIKLSERYKQTLQEIKAIATECTTCGDCCECKYWEDCDTDLEEQALGVCRMILDLITKAEEE